MLNSFKDYKRYIHILNCILDLALPEYMSHWGRASASQGISRYGIDTQNLIIMFPNCILDLALPEYMSHWGRASASQGISRYGIDTQNLIIMSPGGFQLHL